MCVFGRVTVVVMYFLQTRNKRTISISRCAEVFRLRREFWLRYEMFRFFFGLNCIPVWPTPVSDWLNSGEDDIESKWNELL